MKIKNVDNIYKKLRKQANLSQVEVSKILNISQSAISKWENGSVYPDISILPNIADLYDTSIDCLLGRTSINTNSFGERLKSLRKKKDLTQIEFASIFKISNGTIAMWETNKRQPDYDMLLKLAKYFDVSLDYLLGREETSNKNKFINIPQKVIEHLSAFNDLEDFTSEDWEEINKFIAFIKSKKINYRNKKRLTKS